MTQGPGRQEHNLALVPYAEFVARDHRDCGQSLQLRSIALLDSNRYGFCGRHMAAFRIMP